jgi:hypothetical protein
LSTRGAYRADDFALMAVINRMPINGPRRRALLNLLFRICSSETAGYILTVVPPPSLLEKRMWPPDGQSLLSQCVNITSKRSVATEQVGALVLNGLTPAGSCQQRAARGPPNPVSALSYGPAECLSAAVAYSRRIAPSMTAKGMTGRPRQQQPTAAREAWKSVIQSYAAPTAG